MRLTLTHIFLIILAVAFSAGYIGSKKKDTMVLLDEPIAAVHVSQSNGSGEMNMDLLHTFEDEATVALFKQAITTAKKGVAKIDPARPNYDVMVHYKGDLPIHAFHLWLGEQNEKSVWIYMVGEGETHFTPAKKTNELRKVLLAE